MNGQNFTPTTHRLTPAIPKSHRPASAASACPTAKRKASWWRSYYFWIIVYLSIVCLYNMFWIARSSPTLLSESVIYQDQIIRVFNQLQANHTWGEYFLGRANPGWRVPLLQGFNLPFLLLTDRGQWPFFWPQVIFFIAGVIATERLGTLLFSPRVGFICALLTISSLTNEMGLRTCVPDFPLTLLLILTFYVYFKSQGLRSSKSKILFTVLLALGTFLKWSFVPIYLGVPLMYIAVDYIRHRELRLCWSWPVFFLCIAIGVALIYLFFGNVSEVFWQNYQYNRTRSPLSTDGFWQFLSPHFQWCNLLNISVFLVTGDMLPLLGRLFLFCSLVVCCCPRRYRKALLLLICAVLPPLFITSSLFLLLPRYVAPIMPLQMLIIAVVLNDVHRYLRRFLIGIVILAKLIFVGGWLLPIALPVSEYCYQFSDILGIIYSVGTHSSIEPPSWRELKEAMLSPKSKWCDTYFFTSPPYTYPWYDELRRFTDICAHESESPHPRFWTLCTNEQTHSSFDHALRRCLTQSKQYQVSVIPIYNYQEMYHPQERRIQPLADGDYLFAMFILRIPVSDKEAAFRLPSPQALAAFEAGRQQRQNNFLRALPPGWSAVGSVISPQPFAVREAFGKPFDICIFRYNAPSPRSSSEN